MIAMTVVLFSGCKDLPDAATIGSLSKAVGYAAGITCNLTKMSEKTKTNLVEILDIAAEVLPEKDQSFTEVWTPLVKDLVGKAVAEKKIENGEGQLIILAMGVVTKGLDYVFDVRWPNAKKYTDLVAAGTKGFVEGFKSVLKVSLAKGEFPYDKAEYDKAIEFFNQK